MTDLSDLKATVMENGKVLNQHLIECGESNGRMEGRFDAMGIKFDTLGIRVAQLQTVIIAAAGALIVGLVSLIVLLFQRGAHL